MQIIVIVLGVAVMLLKEYLDPQAKAKRCREEKGDEEQKFMEALSIGDVDCVSIMLRNRMSERKAGVSV